VMQPALPLNSCPASPRIPPKQPPSSRRLLGGLRSANPPYGPDPLRIQGGRVERIPPPESSPLWRTEMSRLRFTYPPTLPRSLKISHDDVLPVIITFSVVIAGYALIRAIDGLRTALVNQSELMRARFCDFAFEPGAS